MNVNKLAKILALTQSPNDAEALSAIRMANEVLKDEGSDWKAFLKLYLKTCVDVKAMKKREVARTGKRDYDAIMRLIDMGETRYKYSDGACIVEDRVWGRRTDVVMKMYSGWARELKEKRSISVLGYDCLRQLICCHSYSDYESVIEEYNEIMGKNDEGN